VRIVYIFFLATSPKKSYPLRRVPSSGMLRCVALVRTDVSEERIASIIRFTTMGELVTTLVLTNNRLFVFLRRFRRFLVTANVLNSPIHVTMTIEALSSSETSVPTRTTRCNIPEDSITKQRSSCCGRSCLLRSRYSSVYSANVAEQLIDIQKYVYNRLAQMLFYINRAL
jgi:hypothetical protein